jgi:hypothetical protein
MKKYIVKYLYEGSYKVIEILCKNVIDCHEILNTLLGFKPTVVIITHETDIRKMDVCD